MGRKMDFGALLSQYGLPGIIIFAMGIVIVYQAKRIDTLVERLFAVQESRRLEGLQTQEKVTSVMQSFSQSTELLVDKIQIVRGEK